MLKQNQHEFLYWTKNCSKLIQIAKEQRKCESKHLNEDLERTTPRKQRRSEIDAIEFLREKSAKDLRGRACFCFVQKCPQNAENTISRNKISKRFRRGCTRAPIEIWRHYCLTFLGRQISVSLPSWPEARLSQTYLQNKTIWKSRDWNLITGARLWPLNNNLWFVPGREMGCTVPWINPKQLSSAAPLLVIAFTYFCIDLGLRISLFHWRIRCPCVS